MRALVLSGGGVKGAFEAGVILALTERGFTWDVMAGVSAGAINAAFMAQFAPADQHFGATELVLLWSSITDKDIKKRWFPFGKLHALSKGGLFNTKPLHNLLKKHLSKDKLATSGVILAIGAVSLNTGEYRYVDSSMKEIDKWIMASAAFPIAFPPVEIDGELWVDGGIRDSTPITDVLAQTPQEVDVILASPLEASLGVIDTGKDPLKIALRCAGIMADEIFNTDLDKVFKNNLRVYQPKLDTKLPEDVLTFDPKVIMSLINLGYEVGKTLPVNASV